MAYSGKYKYIQDYLAQNNLNFMTSFAGYDERLDKELNNTLRIYSLICEAVELIWENNNGVGTDNDWITDSIISLGKGVELVNSSLFLLLNNHLPANSYLYRSALNCFWLSHKFVQKGKAWKKYDKNDNKISHVEIRAWELNKIVGIEDDEGEGIIRIFSGILHNEFSQTWRFRKSSGCRKFEISPHDFETNELLENFRQSIEHIRGILEFARAVIQSTFVDLKPETLEEGKYFKSSNVYNLYYKDYRLLVESLKSAAKVDLSVYFKQPSQPE